MNAKRLTARVTAVLLCGLTGMGLCAAQEPGATSVMVAPDVQLPAVRRIGINPGTWHAWGANQLCHNVLQNPGFEGMIDRAIVIVRSVDGPSFSDDVTYLGRPDGFWHGATYDVRTGAAAGTQGTVVDSQRAGPDGFPRYTARAPVPGLGPGDVVALTRTDDAEKPDRWMAGDDVAPVLGDVRPGSPGRRSVVLTADGTSPTDMVTYLDSIGARAGKMLPVQGPWRFAFWAKAEPVGMRLRVRFVRQGSAPFVEQEISPGGDWQATELDFEANDSGPPGTLEVHFWATGTGRVFLDDVELAARNDPPLGFRAAVLQTLQALRPGYLRDWQGGQGFTLDNRLIADFGRRTTRCSPQPDATSFEYGLPEFFDLCRAVGADPWVVAPTPFSDRELRGLGQLVATRAAADGFDDVVVEFGNENWNPLSRASGIPNPPAYGEAAERAFGLLRAGRAPSLRTAVNGQFANPSAAVRFAQVAPTANVLAVAPYFLFSLNAGLTPDQRLAALNPDDTANFGALTTRLSNGPELAVYEVNLHTTGGDAPAAERDPTVGGTAAAAALARRILQAQAAGARRIITYELAGYDMWTNDHKGFVNLWGMVRDLGPTRRLRATGLAVALLNQAIGGDLHRVAVAPDSPDLTAAAYRSPAGWAAVIASVRGMPVPVSVTFPPQPKGALPTRARVLVAADPWVTNDADPAVSIADTPVQNRPDGLELVVPPASMVILVPRGAPS